MSKKIYNIKYFKKLMIIVAILWTAITLFFFEYQIKNENLHLKNNTIKSARDIANASRSLVYWAYEQKVKEIAAKKNIVGGFSIKDMLDNLARNENLKYNIDLSYDQDDLSDLDKKTSSFINRIQKSKKNGYMIIHSYKNNSVYYMTPLIANQNCIICHIHSDEPIGSVIGLITITKKIPKFSNEDSKRYYFFIISYTFTWLVGLFAIWWFYGSGVRFLKNKVKNFETSIYNFVDIIEKKDAYTAGHGKRVAKYSKMIAEKLWCSKEEVELAYRAGMLHDIGKIEIPDALLMKPERLTEEEYNFIKRHPEVGYNLLNKEPFKELSKIVLYHHEHYDGKGYPKGLKGNEIPLLSRVIAVADAFDSLTTSRAYRPALSVKDALDIIYAEKGKHFDPKVLYVAKEVLSSLKAPTGITQFPKNKFEEFKFFYYLKDQLTGTYNCDYVKLIINNKYKNNNFYINCISFPDFFEYNKRHGWREGNNLLKDIAKKIMSAFPNSIVVRMAGDNFLVINHKRPSINNCDKINRIFEQDRIKPICKNFMIDKGHKITLDSLEDCLK